MAFGGTKQGSRKAGQGRKKKTAIESQGPLHETAYAPAPKEKEPRIADMVVPPQGVRKSFLDFPPGISWI